MEEDLNSQRDGHYAEGQTKRGGTCMMEIEIGLNIISFFYCFSVMMLSYIEDVLLYQK